MIGERFVVTPASFRQIRVKSSDTSLEKGKTEYLYNAPDDFLVSKTSHARAAFPDNDL